MASRNEVAEEAKMFFRNLRRRRRRPSPPAFSLDLDLAFDEVLADLIFPGTPG